MIKIGIIGGNSFVGQHLIQQLQQEHEQLKVLIRKKISPNIKGTDNIKFYYGDLENYNSLLSFLEEQMIVINLAYDYTAGMRRNLQGIKNLIIACKEKKIKRLIHCSTISIYGNIKAKLIDETTQAYPVSEYAETKLGMEHVLLSEFNQVFELVIVRPTQIFGPGGKNLIKLMNDLTYKSSFKNYLKCCLMSKKNMNLVSVHNVVYAIVYLMHFDNVSNQIFLISDDDEIKSYYEIESYIRATLGLKKYWLPVIPLPLIIYKMLDIVLQKKSFDPKVIFSNKKISSLGFQKKISLEKSLNEFINSYSVGNQNL